MTQKKRAGKKKPARKKKEEDSIRKELYLGAGILSIVLMIISLHTESGGILGKLLKISLLSLFGIGGYIFPYFLITLSALYFLRKESLKRRAIGLTVFYIALLGVFEMLSYQGEIGSIDILGKIDLALKAGRTGLGGGITGAITSYTTVKLLGFTGAIFFHISMFLGSAIIVSGQNISGLLRSLFKNARGIYERTRTVLRDSDGFEKNNGESRQKELKPEFKKSRKLELPSKRELKILDHNRSESQEDIEEASKGIAVEDDKVEENLPYRYPLISFLREKVESNKGEEVFVRENAKKLMDTLSNFGIEASIDQVSIGPSITQYEIQIAAGIKVSKITGLSNDLALSLAASDIRIEAPIPGKSAIGIEVPNKHKTGVNLREILSSQEFKASESSVPIALGKSVEGDSIVASIEKMPHMLIAGATGSGKSVCINTIITSILYKSSPEEVKLILIDPKVVELSVYNGIPHLLIPVVTDAKKAAGALTWAVQEMNKRYELFAENSVRDIVGYNKKVSDSKRMPKIVMIIDELADLMMVSSSEVEDLICRIAQMARAAGIHLILATQRPSVDVITGTIKANIPSRISFAVSSQTDSRTILDMGGAEKLLGRGDMLYYPVGESKPLRVQGAFIDDEEVEKIVNFVKSNGKADYEEKLMEEVDRELDLGGECDELLSKAIELVVNDGQASISLLQRRFKIGYSRAARIVDQMEERGIVGGREGSKPRKVLVTAEDIK